MDLGKAIEAFRTNPESSGFILDFDGTLAPIVPDPGAARIADGARPVLEDLESTYAVVAMVSGRRAQDVAARVGLAGLRYIGLHGGEEFADGIVVQPEGAEELKSQAEKLAEAASGLIQKQRLTGCRVEQKELAVSLHYRNAEDPGAGDILLAWAQEQGPPEGFKMALGRKVIEFRPSSFSKASAVDRLVEAHALRQLLVAGDDLTDVEAMRRAGEREGLCSLRIGVDSAEAPAALADQTEVVVGSTDELISFLRRFVETSA